MSKNDENVTKSYKTPRKITPERLKNIALYYLQRFDSSVDNLRQVLKRRIIDYARQTPEFDKTMAFDWVEKILSEFENLGYLNDQRYTEVKINSYLNLGKPARYIKIKLQQKGIESEIIDSTLENQEYDAEAMAHKLAKRKKIGPYRIDDDERKNNRQKDLATLVRAGFDYEVAQKVIGGEIFDDYI